jgi:2-oxoisovalerate dehydrogenase E1 component
MGAIALAVRDTDALALHYRHLAVQLVRQLKAGRSDAAILLDRARAHTVAASDPVTGGAHCAIGGGDYDFLVTSTLASQACPAVGRAMGNGLAQFMASTTPDFKPLFEKDMVSFVSLGDGSVNNAHFLSAVNLAEYAAFRKFKCPAVFAVSDNDLSISLRGYGYLSKQWLKGLQMPLFTAKGDDFLSIYAATKQAVDSARSKSAPAFLYINNIARRFGHAATDRQAAYLTPAEITKLAATNPVEKICQLAAGAGVVSFAEQAALFEQLWESTRAAFNDAAAEPKISSRADMLARVSIPLAPLPAAAAAAEGVTGATGTAAEYAGSASAAGHFPAGLEPLVDRSAFQNVQTRVTGKLQAPRVDAGLEAVPANPETRDVMRKHMTKVFDELMATYPNMAYLGEDVVHGGYYLVTEGLAAKYPHRVRDFPPDETSLIGAGIGFAQTGLLPVVEIPYAKYLDCGADMFYEAALSSWLSNTKQPNGMIVRLQGFGKGVFGGNFHTHNTLYMPPGIDVVRPLSSWLTLLRLLCSELSHEDPAALVFFSVFFFCSTGRYATPTAPTMPWACGMRRCKPRGAASSCLSTRRTCSTCATWTSTTTAGVNPIRTPSSTSTSTRCASTRLLAPRRLARRRLVVSRSSRTARAS